MLALPGLYGLAQSTASLPPRHRGLTPNHKENSNKNIKCLHRHFLEVTNDHFAWREDLRQSLKSWEREKWRLQSYCSNGLWKQIVILFLLFSNDLWLSYCMVLVSLRWLCHDGGKQALGSIGCAMFGWRRRKGAKLVVALPFLPCPLPTPSSPREGDGTAMITFNF